ncbi:hypothetical protein OQA88_13390 [Cercophora sp. LCS_1]
MLAKSITLLALGLWAIGAVAAPAAVDVDYCTTFPTWSVTDFFSDTTDSVGSGGKATWKLINNLSGASDEMTCTLQVNYRCIVTGTPSDKDLTVHVAVRSGTLTFILDKEVDGCPGRTTPLRIIGNTEFELNCSWEEVGGKVTCAQTEKMETVQGSVVELAPEAAPTVAP